MVNLSISRTRAVFRVRLYLLVAAIASISGSAQASQDPPDPTKTAIEQGLQALGLTGVQVTIVPVANGKKGVVLRGDVPSATLRTTAIALSEAALGDKAVFSNLRVALPGRAVSDRSLGRADRPGTARSGSSVDPSSSEQTSGDDEGDDRRADVGAADKVVVFDHYSKRLHFVDNKTGEETLGSAGTRFRVRAGTKVSVRLINFNTLAYDAAAELDNRFFFAAAPAVFTENLLPPSGKPDDATADIQDTWLAAVARFEDAATTLLYAGNLGDRIHDHIKSFPALSRSVKTAINENVEAMVIEGIGLAEGDEFTASTIIRRGGELWDELVAEKEKLDVERRKALQNATQERADLINQQFEALQERYATIRATKESGALDKAFQQAASLYTRHVTGVLYEKRFDPTEARGDILEGRISITPAGAAVGSVASVTPFEVLAYGQILLNFSSGVLFSNLTNPEYATATRPKRGSTTGETEKVIIRRGESEFQPSLGALLHVYRKSGKSIQPALSVGLSLRDSMAQYLLGASLLVGHDRRFVATFGIAGASVNRLDPGLRVGAPLPDDRTDITRSVFRTGLFLGLTYNID